METKTLTAEIFSTKSAGSGEFEAILSTPSKDRDGEIVEYGALDPLPDHIAIDVDHGLKVMSTVGSGKPYYADGVLKFKGRFASTPLAQEVRSLIVEGHIRNVSIVMAFGKKEKRPDGITYITKAELINATVTGIPANTQASILSAKSFIDALDEKVGARNSSKDSERIQGAHDLFVELGAMCSAEKCAHVDVDTKSTDTEPPATGPAEAAPDAGAEVDVVRAAVALALARAELVL